MSAATQGRRALITGATGFIGTNLIRRMLADGWQISVVIQKGLSAEPLGDDARRVQLFDLDGTTEQLKGIVAEAKPDVVFQKGLKLMLKTVEGEQTENGSWSAWPGTRPPIFGNSE